ncbi:4-coumarate--CoA ligase 4, partial [Pseudolycoriella hygida]
FILNSIYEPISLPELTIDQYVWQNISAWQDKVAIVCGATGRKYTYAKLRDHSAATAIKLQTKLQTGDVAAVCLPNIPEFAISVLGILEAGLVVTTINPIYTAEEISRQLISSKPKIVFALAETYKTIKAAAEIAKISIEIVIVKNNNSEDDPSGTINFSQLISTLDVDFSSLKRNAININEMSTLLFSSGTTGLPKGVMLSHLNITTNCEMLNAKLPERTLLQPTTNDFQEVLPSVLPFHHIYGYTVSLLAKLSLGCKVVTLPKFDPSTFLNSLIEHKATILNLVPPIVLFLGGSDKVSEDHLKYVRMVASAGAPLGASDADRFKKKAPQVEFMQGYGMTETSALSFLSPNDCWDYATIGYAASNTQAKVVKLDDSDYVGCDKNEVGELLVRGHNVMKGYLNNKEATDAAIVKGNWLRTGDMVFYNENGLCYIVDRLKELIKVKGYQVAPAELEEILRSHPNIQDAAVIGIAHELYGEIPKAFVVKRKGATIQENDIHAFTNKKIVDYKQLRGGVQFVDSVPKSSTGKILRRELKKLYC